MRGFWKSIYGASDPSINHVWVTNAPFPSHSFSRDTNDDRDTLSGIRGHQLVYVMFGGAGGRQYSTADFQRIITQIARSLGND